jgi:hypothetical protein
LLLLPPFAEQYGGQCRFDRNDKIAMTVNAVATFSDDKTLVIGKMMCVFEYVVRL